MNKYIKPDWKHTALLTIDTQNDFSLPGTKHEIKGTYEIIPKMEIILNICRQHKIPIIHVIRIYKTDGSNVDNCRRELIENGNNIAEPYSKGADLVKEIKPKDADELEYEELLEGKIQTISNLEWAMYKPRWGAFYKTKLDEFLKNELDINTLIFIGCNFPNCPRTSIYEASERDFRIIMVEDAISGVYAKGLEELRNIGVNVLNSEQVVEEIKQL